MAAWLLGRGEGLGHAELADHDPPGHGGILGDCRHQGGGGDILRTGISWSDLARHTRRTIEDLRRAIERDRWMTPEAKEFGLIVCRPRQRKAAGWPKTERAP